MSGSNGNRLSSAAQQRAGLPQGFQTWSAFPFAGLNKSASRLAIDDKEFFWLENYLRIGDGYLRTLWDAGAAFYTAPAGKAIVCFFWFNIGAAVYVAVFFHDGTAVQVAYPTGVVTTISSVVKTFYDPATGQLPACVQSGSQYLIISNNNTQNDYWIWDGTILYEPGSIAPVVPIDITDGGSGYTSVPSYTVYGGTGTGVTLTPVIAEGSVVSLTVTNPGTGYSPGDIAQVGFSGGGSDTTPRLTAALAAGAISHITLVAGGTGFAIGTYALGFAGGGGSGAAGTYTVTSTGGPVVAINLTSSGTGYTTAPAISFPSGGGLGAAAVALLGQSGVASITIVNGGTGLTGTPVLTIQGGGGAGAQATCTVVAGVINSVTVSNAGSGYTTAPAVIVQTGLNNAAAATLQMMPFGVSGTTMETYQSRVWIAFPKQNGKQNNGGTFFVSAPESLVDFSTSAGGDIFTNTDRYLRAQYTFLRQTSNFLYAVADSSTSVISNVQTGGTPTTTIFSYQNADPQFGSSWRDTAQDFSNKIMFTNALGMYEIYGGSVRKATKKFDRLFTDAVLPPIAGALTPTSAVANIYSQLVYLTLMTVQDPFNFTSRNVMMYWDGTEGGIASQTPGLIYIGTQEINSNPQAWGTDGTSLYQLFATPSSSLVKVASTKMFGGQQSFLIKMTHSLYLDAEDLSAGQSGLTFTGSVDADGLAVPAINSVTSALASCPSGSYAFSAPLQFVAPKGNGAMYGCGVGAGMPQVPGIGIGVTLASSSPDYVLRNITLGYMQQTGIA